MQTSLTKFCKDNDLPKSTVYRRCQELGLDTANGLSPADLATVMNEFDLTPPVVTSAVTVEVGNHQIVLDNPLLPQCFTLDSLRADESIQLHNPAALATQFIEAADLVTTAMQQDIERREAKLGQTRKAKDAIAKKAAELHLEQRLYQQQTHMIDTAQTTETETLQQALAALQSLGKSSPS
jgi:hypothetical protein